MTCHSERIDEVRLLEDLKEVAYCGHEGLIDLLNNPPLDNGIDLVRMSTCALAIRAALYDDLPSNKVFASPYRIGKAFSDLWALVHYPRKDEYPFDGDIGIALIDDSHVAVVRVDTRYNDRVPGSSFYLSGVECGQVNPDGKQTCELVTYRGRWGTVHPAIGRDYRFRRRLTGWSALGCGS